jgi:outer membrane receptor for ferrienterochelin and colicins
MYYILKFIKITVFIVLLCFISTNLYAHNKTIKGTITIKNGESEPVIGATVMLLGTNLGTKTDKDGKFIIKRVPDGKFIMTITRVGLKPIQKEINIEHVAGDELLLYFEMEEDPIQTTSIVVTATRSDKIYEDTPIKVSVIDTKALLATPSNNIKDGLQFMPGVRTETNCQNCGFSQVRLNGLEGKYSQILIDGRSIFSALNGVYGLEQIPLNMLDRIEIIRGGGSSLYGGNAIAGVINIITKDPCFNTFTLDYKQSFVDGKTPDFLASLSGSVISPEQDYGLYFWGSKNYRNPWDANDDGYTEIGLLNTQNFGGKAYYQPNTKDKYTLEVNFIDHLIRGGDKLNLPPHFTDITEQARHRTSSISTNYYRILNNGNSKLNIFAAYQNTERESYYGSGQDPNAYGTTKNDSYNIGASLVMNAGSFAGIHLITIGYDYIYDWMIDSAPSYDRLIDQTAYSHGAYLQDDWSLTESFNLLLGARVDKHNLINNAIICPRASLIYKPLEDLSIRAVASTGFRAPQAFDEDLHITQVGGEGFVIFVDENLKPEYSKSISVSVDYSLKSLDLPVSLSLEYFYTQLEDAFVLENTGSDANGNLLMLRTNGDKAKVYGSTIEAMLMVSNNMYFKSGITIQKSLYNTEVEWFSGDPDAGLSAKYSDQILRTPDIYGYASAYFMFLKDFTLDLNCVYTGSMFVPHYAGYINDNILVKTQEFLDFSSKLTYEIIHNPSLKISAGVQNIFNSYQTDFDKGINRDAGYIYGPGKPRTLFFGIQTSI